MITPRCHGMQELPEADAERSKVCQLLASCSSESNDTGFALEMTPLFAHLAHGLAYTAGSALGSTPPTIETCLSAFIVPNSAGLTAGARAWSKHFHRSQSSEAREGGDRRELSAGWWGSPSGPVSVINDKAVALFWKIVDAASWRNLHWLPHQVLVYEVRVLEGYGMRWSQNCNICVERSDGVTQEQTWTFRGFLEPQMEDGHKNGWRH